MPLLKRLKRTIDENRLDEMVDAGIIGEPFRRLPREKKERVYAVAVKLLGKFGYDGLSVDRFCRRAGISKGSFFQYFPTKSHLLEFTIVMFDRYLEQYSHSATSTSVAGLDDFLNWFGADCPLTLQEKRFYLFVTEGLRHSAVLLEGIDLSRHLRDEFRLILRSVPGRLSADQIEFLTGGLLSGWIQSSFVRGRAPSPALVARLL